MKRNIDNGFEFYIKKFILVVTVLNFFNNNNLQKF
jgi:hypothetical protein